MVLFQILDLGVLDTDKGTYSAAASEVVAAADHEKSTTQSPDYKTPSGWAHWNVLADEPWPHSPMHNNHPLSNGLIDPMIHRDRQSLPLQLNVHASSPSALELLDREGVCFDVACSPGPYHRLRRIWNKYHHQQHDDQEISAGESLGS